MIHPAFIFCTVYFILGALGFYKANKSATPEIKKERWTKLIVFAVIVYSILSLILFKDQWLKYLVFPIIGIAIYEVTSVAFKHKGKYGIMILAVFYLLFSGGWMWSFKTSASADFMLYAFFLVFVFDGFAQVAGILFGKKQIFPKTSPNKSIEGFLGGFVMCIISAVIFKGWVGLELSDAIKYGVIIGFCAISGDWLASKYKRTFGIKDFSKLIPGHGGVLDRFDSWILTSAILGILLFV